MWKSLNCFWENTTTSGNRTSSLVFLDINKGISIW